MNLHSKTDACNSVRQPTTGHGDQSDLVSFSHMGCRLTTKSYRHRFARAAPAPLLEQSVRFKESWTCVNHMVTSYLCIHNPSDL